jgi:hypothetical protein
MLNSGEKALPCLTLNFLCSKYDFRIRYSRAGINCFSLNRSPLCHTLSNACATSRKRPVQHFLFSSAEAIVSVRRCTWCRVECFDRKPNWVLGKILCSDKMGLILLRRHFSKSLTKVGNKLMGLYEVTMFLGLPTFGMRITTSLFQMAGKYYRRSMEL